MFKIEINGSNMLVNKNKVYFDQYPDMDDKFCFILSPNKLNMRFRGKNNDELYPFNNLNVDTNTDYFITTETDMDIKDYKVSIEGMKNLNDNRNDDISVFVNGNNEYKIKILEESPDAEFSGFNTLHKEDKFDGIIEYNKDDEKDHKGRFNFNKNSMIKVENDGDVCLVWEDRSGSRKELKKFLFDQPKIFNKYKDHRIGIKNSSAPGIKNACYMICAFQGLYHSNEVLKLSYNGYEEKNPSIIYIFTLKNNSLLSFFYSY